MLFMFIFQKNIEIELFQEIKLCIFQEYNHKIVHEIGKKNWKN